MNGIPITPSLVAEVSARLSELPLEEGCLGTLRKEWPDVRFTYCNEDLIHGAKAVCEGAGFSLYLIDTSQHCLSLTTSFERAGGILVAEVIA